MMVLIPAPDTASGLLDQLLAPLHGARHRQRPETHLAMPRPMGREYPIDVST
jgi:hypothetical protein